MGGFPEQQTERRLRFMRHRSPAGQGAAGKRPASRGRRILAAGCSVAAVTLIAAACSSSGNGAAGSSSGITVPGGIGSVPAAATGAEKAGTITWAMQPNAVPNWIFPVLNSANNSVYNQESFIWEMWRPLYWTQNGVVPEVVPSMSLADLPVFSNGDKSLSITMKSNYKWSDGQPVTSQDLAFDIDLTKAAVKESPANWASYTPGYFPDDIVSMSTPNSSTLVMNLSSPVNPSWFTQDILAYAGPIDPLPAHAWAKASVNGPILDFTNPANATKIYNFLAAQNKSVNTYATNPLWQVVDGPYKLSVFNATTGAFTMVPNTTYGGPHAAKMSNFQGVPFTSEDAEFNAIKAGSIDVGLIPQADIPQIPQVKRLGYNVFGEPDYSMNFVNYNFKDTTGHFNAIANQLYFRQAMAHLEDQQGYINAFFHGAGDPSYGPIPAYPKSPYLPANAATNPYPFSVSDAVSLLKSHGWTVTPGGTDTCTSAGSGANQCGAGIPAGTKLSFNLIYDSQLGIITEMITDLTSKAKQAGINISLAGSNFNYMISNYNDPAAPANENKWAMEDFGGETLNPYATTFGLFNTNGSTQIGDYSNPTADSLIQASISGTNPSAVKNEAAFLTQNQPVIFQPLEDYTWAWKTSVSGTPASFENLTQYYATPEFWYLTK
jgi:peptide/nickel transport system substrate-binding protein